MRGKSWVALRDGPICPNWPIMRKTKLMLSEKLVQNNTTKIHTYIHTYIVFTFLKFYPLTLLAGKSAKGRAEGEWGGGGGGGGVRGGGTLNEHWLGGPDPRNNHWFATKIMNSCGNICRKIISSGTEYLTYDDHNRKSPRPPSAYTRPYILLLLNRSTKHQWQSAILNNAWFSTGVCNSFLNLNCLK